MKWVSRLIDQLFKLIRKAGDWIRNMTCTAKAIAKVNRDALPNQPATELEKEKINGLCSLKYPWYVAANIILQDRTRTKIEQTVSSEFSDLTEEELEWISDCLKYPEWDASKLIAAIRESRKSKTSLPEPK